ncbi:MAG: hypothetical protein JNL52_12230 [Flavobacteriales bacterium]|nr:hypothetical protein [Flavobacteriales bacterium]
MKNVVIAAAVAALFIGCGSSTRLVTSWRDPSVSVEEGSLNKVLFVALLKDEATRRAAEDELVARSKAQGVASYAYFGSNVEAINAPGMNDRMINDGIDGVVIMRLVDLTKEQTYVPGTAYPAYYASPYGYYGYAAPMYYNPGYVRTDVTYTIETNIYGTKQGKLVWTGTTSTVNPSDLSTTVREIMEEIHWKMVKEGFLRRPSSK